MMQWFKKSVSTLVILTMFAETCFAQVPGLSLDMAFKTETPKLIQIDIPAELASVEEFWEAPARPNPKMILQIQNAHTNYEAQTKIRDLMHYLNESYGFKTIFVEGASEELNPDYLKLFPDAETNKKLWDELAKRGQITGADWFLLEGGQGAKGVGIEKAELYRKNYEALKAVYGRESETTRFLAGLESELDKLATKILPPETRKIIADWKKFEKGHREFIPFVETLAKLAKLNLDLDLRALYSQIEWPQLTRILVLQEMEKKLQARAAESERQAMSEWMKKNNVRRELIEGLERFNEKDINMNRIRASSGKMESLPRFFVEKLVEEAGPKGLKFSEYPNFALYTGYLILKYELEPNTLFEEIRKLFDQLLEQGTKDKEQGSVIASEAKQSSSVIPEKAEIQPELIQLFKDAELVRKLLNLELSRGEWGTVLARKAELEPQKIFSRVKSLSTQNLKTGTQNSDSKLTSYQKEILTAFENAFSFYDLAVQRDEVFYEKMSKALETTDRAILMTGGFHTEGLREIFREKEISYGTITPRLEKVEKSNLYREVMLGKSATSFHAATVEIASLLNAEVLNTAELAQKLMIVLDSVLAIKDADQETAVANLKTIYARHGVTLEIDLQKQTIRVINADSQKTFAIGFTDEISRQKGIWDEQYSTAKTAEGAVWAKPQLFMDKEMMRAVELVGKPVSEIEVLDAGAGNGDGGSLWLAQQKFKKVIHTDISGVALAQFRTRLESENLPSDLREGDIEEVLKSLPDQSSDIVHAHLSLHYFSYAKTLAIFKEIRRVLRPNGVFIFKVFSDADTRDLASMQALADRGLFFEDKGGKTFRLFREEDLNSLINDSGLRYQEAPQKITIDGFMNQPWIVMARSESRERVNDSASNGNMPKGVAIVVMDLKVSKGKVKVLEVQPHVGSQFTGYDRINKKPLFEKINERLDRLPYNVYTGASVFTLGSGGVRGTVSGKPNIKVNAEGGVGSYLGDKRMMNGLFSKSGLDEYRPNSKYVLKNSDPVETTATIRQTMPASSGHYVIKPTNSTRGQGIIFVKAEDLESELQRLRNLSPREYVEPKANRDTDPYAYWESDLSPGYIIEEMVDSDPVTVDGQEFNGTMRAVVLITHQDNPDGSDGVAVDVLGTYWKLPAVSLGGGSVAQTALSRMHLEGEEDAVNSARVDPDLEEVVAAELKKFVPRAYLSMASANDPMIELLDSRQEEDKAYGLYLLEGIRRGDPDAVVSSETLIPLLEYSNPWIQKYLKAYIAITIRQGEPSSKALIPFIVAAYRSGEDMQNVISEKFYEQTAQYGASWKKDWSFYDELRKKLDIPLRKARSESRAGLSDADIIRIMLELRKAYSNGHDWDSFYLNLQEIIDPRAKVITDLGKPKGAEAIAAVESELGIAYLRFLVEPGISTRTDQFIDFVKKSPSFIGRRDDVISAETAKKIRESFKSHLETLRPREEYRSLNVSEEEANEMMRDGLLARDIKKLVASQVDLSGVEEVIRSLENAGTEAERKQILRQQYFEDTDLGYLLSASGGDGGAIAGSGLRFNVLSHVSHMGGGGPVMSITQFSEVGDNVAATRGTEKTVYRFNLKVPEIFVIRWNDAYFPRFIKGEDDERRSPDAKDTVETPLGELHKNHPSVESFVLHSIAPEWIEGQPVLIAVSETSLSASSSDISSDVARSEARVIPKIELNKGESDQKISDFFIRIFRGVRKDPSQAVVYSIGPGAGDKIKPGDGRLDLDRILSDIGATVNIFEPRANKPQDTDSNVKTPAKNVKFSNQKFHGQQDSADLIILPSVLSEPGVGNPRAEQEKEELVRAVARASKKGTYIYVSHYKNANDREADLHEKYMAQFSRAGLQLEREAELNDARHQGIIYRVTQKSRSESRGPEAQPAELNQKGFSGLVVPGFLGALGLVSAGVVLPAVFFAWPLLTFSSMVVGVLGLFIYLGKEYRKNLDRSQTANRKTMGENLAAGANQIMDGLLSSVLGIERARHPDAREYVLQWKVDQFILGTVSASTGVMGLAVDGALLWNFSSEKRISSRARSEARDKNLIRDASITAIVTLGLALAFSPSIAWIVPGVILGFVGIVYLGQKILISKKNPESETVKLFLNLTPKDGDPDPAGRQIRLMRLVGLGVFAAFLAMASGVTISRDQQIKMNDAKALSTAIETTAKKESPSVLLASTEESIESVYDQIFGEKSRGTVGRARLLIAQEMILVIESHLWEKMQKGKDGKPMFLAVAKSNIEVGPYGSGTGGDLLRRYTGPDLKSITPIQKEMKKRIADHLAKKLGFLNSAALKAHIAELDTKHMKAKGLKSLNKEIELQVDFELGLEMAPKLLNDNEFDVGMGLALLMRYSIFKGELTPSGIPTWVAGDLIPNIYGSDAKKRASAEALFGQRYNQFYRSSYKKDKKEQAKIDAQNARKAKEVAAWMRKYSVGDIGIAQLRKKQFDQSLEAAIVASQTSKPTSIAVDTAVAPKASAKAKQKVAVATKPKETPISKGVVAAPTVVPATLSVAKREADVPSAIPVSETGILPSEEALVDLAEIPTDQPSTKIPSLSSLSLKGSYGTWYGAAAALAILSLLLGRIRTSWAQRWSENLLANAGINSVLATDFVLIFSYLNAEITPALLAVSLGVPSLLAAAWIGIQLRNPAQFRKLAWQSVKDFFGFMKWLSIMPFRILGRLLKREDVQKQTRPVLIKGRSDALNAPRRSEARQDAAREERMNVAVRSVAGHSLLTHDDYGQTWAGFYSLVQQLFDSRQSQPPEKLNALVEDFRMLRNRSARLQGQAEIYRDVKESPDADVLFREIIADADALIAELPEDAEATRIIELAEMLKAIADTQLQFIEQDFKTETVKMGTFLKETMQIIAKTAIPLEGKTPLQITFDVKDDVDLLIQPRLFMRMLGEIYKNAQSISDKRSAKDKKAKPGFNIKFEVINGEAVLTIMDNLGGIEEKNKSLLESTDFDERKKIFTPEGTTTGGGVGLTEAWHVMQGHGGSIDVNNRDDASGTVFTMRWPLKRSEMRTADGGLVAIEDSKRAKQEFEIALEKNELTREKANTTGANEAFIYKGSRGSWYAKQYNNPDQARAELLSWFIYRQLDIPVAQEMFVVEVKNDAGEITGDVLLVSKMMPGDAVWDGYEDSNLAAQEFVASAFTQDRDRSKPDNYRKYEGRIYALDFGSSAMFRSNGEIKGQGEDQDAEPFSRDNFADMLSIGSQHHSKSFFRKLTQDQINRQIAFAADRLNRIVLTKDGKKEPILIVLINAAFVETSLVKDKIFDVYTESAEELNRLASAFEFAEEESASSVITEAVKPFAIQQVLTALRDAWLNFIRFFTYRKANYADLERFSVESKLDKDLELNDNPKFRRVVPVLDAFLTKQDASELISQKILEVNRFGKPELTINPLQLAKWDKMPWYHGFDGVKVDSETDRPILDEIIFGDNPGLRPSIPIEGGVNRLTVTRHIKTAQNYVGEKGSSVILAFDPVRSRGFLTDPFAPIMDASAVVENKNIPLSALTDDSKKYVISRYPDKTAEQLADALGVTEKWVDQVREDIWSGKVVFDEFGLTPALNAASARSETRSLISIRNQESRVDPELVRALFNRITKNPALGMTAEDADKILKEIFDQKAKEVLSPYELDILEYFTRGAGKEIKLDFYPGTWHHADSKDVAVGAWEGVPFAKFVQEINLGPRSMRFEEAIKGAWEVMLHEFSHVMDGLNPELKGYNGVQQQNLAYREFRANLWSVSGDVARALKLTTMSYSVMQNILGDLMDASDPAQLYRAIEILAQEESGKLNSSKVKRALARAGKARSEARVEEPTEIFRPSVVPQVSGNQKLNNLLGGELRLKQTIQFLTGKTDGQVALNQIQNIEVESSKDSEHEVYEVKMQYQNELYQFYVKRYKEEVLSDRAVRKSPSEAALYEQKISKILSPFGLAPEVLVVNESQGLMVQKKGGSALGLDDLLKPLFMQKLAYALGRMHGLGVAHGDLGKSGILHRGNILGVLSYWDTRAVFIDFESSKIRDEDELEFENKRKEELETVLSFFNFKTGNVEKDLREESLFQIKKAFFEHFYQEGRESVRASQAARKSVTEDGPLLAQPEVFQIGEKEKVTIAVLPGNILKVNGQSFNPSKSRSVGLGRAKGTDVVGLTEPDVSRVQAVLIFNGKNWVLYNYSDTVFITRQGNDQPIGPWQPVILQARSEARKSQIKKFNFDDSGFNKSKVSSRYRFTTAHEFEHVELTEAEQREREEKFRKLDSELSKHYGADYLRQFDYYALAGFRESSGFRSKEPEQSPALLIAVNFFSDFNRILTGNSQAPLNPKSNDRLVSSIVLDVFGHRAFVGALRAFKKENPAVIKQALSEIAAELPDTPKEETTTNKKIEWRNNQDWVDYHLVIKGYQTFHAQAFWEDSRKQNLSLKDKLKLTLAAMDHQREQQIPELIRGEATLERINALKKAADLTPEQIDELILAADKARKRYAKVLRAYLYFAFPNTKFLKLSHGSKQGLATKVQNNQIDLSNYDPLHFSSGELSSSTSHAQEEYWEILVPVEQMLDARFLAAEMAADQGYDFEFIVAPGQYEVVKRLSRNELEQLRASQDAIVRSEVRNEKWLKEKSSKFRTILGQPTAQRAQEFLIKLMADSPRLEFFNYHNVEHFNILLDIVQAALNSESGEQSFYDVDWMREMLNAAIYLHDAGLFEDANDTDFKTAEGQLKPITPGHEVRGQELVRENAQKIVGNSTGAQLDAQAIAYMIGQTVVKLGADLKSETDWEETVFNDLLQRRPTANLKRFLDLHFNGVDVSVDENRQKIMDAIIGGRLLAAADITMFSTAYLQLVPLLNQEFRIDNERGKEKPVAAVNDLDALGKETGDFVQYVQTPRFEALRGKEGEEGFLRARLDALYFNNEQIQNQIKETDAFRLQLVGAINLLKEGRGTADERAAAKSLLEEFVNSGLEQEVYSAADAEKLNQYIEQIARHQLDQIDAALDELEANYLGEEQIARNVDLPASNGLIKKKDTAHVQIDRVLGGIYVKSVPIEDMEEVKILLNEAKNIARLAKRAINEHVSQVRRVGYDSKTVWLELEGIEDGVDLSNDAWLGLSVDQKSKFLIEFAKFFQKMHSPYEGQDGILLHRDIKPENILFNPAYANDPQNPKAWMVIDFGNAGKPGEPNTGRTPDYTAPEITNTKSEQGWSTAADIFSFGKMVQSFFVGSNWELKEGVPESIKGLIQSMTQEEISNRKPQSMSDVADQIGQIFANRSETRTIPTAAWKRRLALQKNFSDGTVEEKARQLKSLIAQAQGNDALIELLNYPSFVLFFLGLKPAYIATGKNDGIEPMLPSFTQEESNFPLLDLKAKALLEAQGIIAHSAGFLYRADDVIAKLGDEKIKNWLRSEKLLTADEENFLNEALDASAVEGLIESFSKNFTPRRKDALHGILLGVPFDEVVNFDEFLHKNEPVDLVIVEPEKISNISLSDIAFAAKRNGEKRISPEVNGHMARYYDALAYFYSLSDVSQTKLAGKMDEGGVILGLDEHAEPLRMERIARQLGWGERTSRSHASAWEMGVRLIGKRESAEELKDLESDSMDVSTEQRNQLSERINSKIQSYFGSNALRVDPDQIIFVKSNSISKYALGGVAAAYFDRGIMVVNQNVLQSYDLDRVLVHESLHLLFPGVAQTNLNEAMTEFLTGEIMNAPIREENREYYNYVKALENAMNLLGRDNPEELKKKILEAYRSGDLRVILNYLKQIRPASAEGDFLMLMNIELFSSWGEWVAGFYPSVKSKGALKYFHALKEMADRFNAQAELNIQSGKDFMAGQEQLHEDYYLFKQVLLKQLSDPQIIFAVKRNVVPFENQILEEKALQFADRYGFDFDRSAPRDSIETDLRRSEARLGLSENMLRALTESEKNNAPAPVITALVAGGLVFVAGEAAMENLQAVAGLMAPARSESRLNSILRLDGWHTNEKSVTIEFTTQKRLDELEAGDMEAILRANPQARYGFVVKSGVINSKWLELIRKYPKQFMVEMNDINALRRGVSRILQGINLELIQVTGLNQDLDAVDIFQNDVLSSRDIRLISYTEEDAEPKKHFVRIAQTVVVAPSADIRDLREVSAELFEKEGVSNKSWRVVSEVLSRIAGEIALQIQAASQAAKSA